MQLILVSDTDTFAMHIAEQKAAPVLVAKLHEERSIKCKSVWVWKNARLVMLVWHD